MAKQCILKSQTEYKDLSLFQLTGSVILDVFKWPLSHMERKF